MIIERPIRFPNRKGEHLFGMLYEPEHPGAGPRTGVLFCVDAIKYRVGTYRLHTMLARWLAERGYFAMTFDPAGIGDSEGVFEEKFRRAHHLDIQRGKYKEDTHDASALFQAQCKVERVMLFGVCGGAISMLIAGATDPRANGLILAAVPVLLEAEDNLAQDDDEVAIINSERHAGAVLADFVKKVGSGETWRKLASFDIHWATNIKIALKATSVFVQKTMSRFIHPLKKKADGKRDLPMSQHPRFNRLFQDSFHSVAERGLPILLVFADQDPITWQFKSEFQDIVLHRGNPWERVYEIYEIEKSNHVFSAPESRQRLFECLGDWLARRFPVA